MVIDVENISGSLEINLVGGEAVLKVPQGFAFRVVNKGRSTTVDCGVETDDSAENIVEFNGKDSSLKIRCISKAMAKDLEAMGFGVNMSRENYRPFIAKRQLQPCFSASTQMHFCPKGNETAGLAVVQAMNHQLRIEMCSDGEGQVLRVVLLTADWNVPPYFPGFESQTQEQILFETPWNETVAVLRIDMVGEDWSIYAGTAEDRLEKLCSVDGRLINPEKVGCMVGTMLGVFASGNGTDSDNEAVFDWFDCGEI